MSPVPWKSAILLAGFVVACETPPQSPYVSIDGSVASRDASIVDLGPDASTALVSSFDPSAAYLHGTFTEGACERGAIDDFSAATRPLAGFDCYTQRGGIIRPSDGRLLYVLGFGTDNQIRVFAADSWRLGSNTTLVYPDDPLANDGTIATPECTLLAGFRIEPDSSDVLYWCTACAPGVACTNVVYRASGGTYVHEVTGGTLTTWWPGYGGIVLRFSNTGLELASEGNASIPVSSDLPDFEDFPGRIHTARPQPDGFRVVTFDGLQFAAYRIALDGTLVMEGTYPTWADDYHLPAECVLAGDGALFCVTYRPFLGEDVVLRLDMGASEAVVVHDEANGPTVLLHGSVLFTGP